jgi:hypothetical protein
MATNEERIAQLEATLKELRESSLTLAKRLLAIETQGGSVRWRAPLIALTGMPAPTSKATSGTIVWKWLGAGPAPAVTYAIDGGQAQPAPLLIEWGPLAPGSHRVDFFAPGSRSPEFSYHWNIEE